MTERPAHLVGDRAWLRQDGVQLDAHVSAVYRAGGMGRAVTVTTSSADARTARLARARRRRSPAR